MSLIRPISLLLVAFAICACETTRNETRGKEIRVTPQIMAAYFYYSRKAHSASAFAVSTDSKNFGFRHCQPDECHSASVALDVCNQNAIPRGKKCEVFAYGRQVSWRGPVKYSSLKKGQNYAALIIERRRRSGRWIFSGTATSTQESKIIYLDMNGGCSGQANKETKRWKISCNYSDSFEGTFSAGFDDIYVGSGRAFDGRTAEIKIFWN